jgi:sodium-dependent dicarboxylate transporter 2/3/5
MLLLLSIPEPEGFSLPAWRLVALAAWMVLWWMTEAVPLAVTALLPIPLMPLLGIVAGKAGEKAVAGSYGHPLIFLFLGGFFIAAAMQRWGLHRRIALHIVRLIGGNAASIIAAFMIATAFLSMWISNTAATVVMFAVGLSIIEFVSGQASDARQTRAFGIALMLGIAYSASIGGVGTLIGTPPNLFLASYLGDSYNITIDFTTWMLVGIPLVFIMLPLAWWFLCRLFDFGELDMGQVRLLIHGEIQKLGPMTRGERTVLVVFVVTALLWLSRQWLVGYTGLYLSDTSIALLAACLLFTLPASLEKGECVLAWEVAKDIPWGVLLLFGGGLALAGAFQSTGLAATIGNAVSGIEGVEISLLVLVTILTVVFLTEVTSNTATTATFLPILSAVAVGFDVSPLMLALPVALAASMAFMMPVATPPNAIVFSFQGMQIQDMMKAGIWMNCMMVAVVYLAVLFLAPLVFAELL